MRFTDDNNQVLQFFQESVVETQLQKLKTLMDKGPKEVIRNKKKFMEIATPIVKGINKIPELEKKIVKQSIEYMKKERIKNSKSIVMKYKSKIKKYIQNDKRATVYASIAAALSIKNKHIVDNVINNTDNNKNYSIFKIVFGLLTICLGIVVVTAGYTILFPFVMGTVLLVKGFMELIREDPLETGA